MEKRLHPLGKVEFDNLEGRLRIDEGVIYEKGDDVSVQGGTHTFYGVKKQVDGSYDLTNTVCCRELTPEERNALRENIQICFRPPTVREKLADAAREHGWLALLYLSVGAAALYKILHG